MNRRWLIGLGAVGLLTVGVWLYTTTKTVTSTDEAISESAERPTQETPADAVPTPAPADEIHSTADSTPAESPARDAARVHAPPTEPAVRERTLPDGDVERVTILEPDDLPYRIRRVERVRVDAPGVEQVLHRTEMVADHVLIQFQPHATEADLNDILARHGAELGRRISARGLYRVTIPDADWFDAAPDLVRALGEYTDLLRYAEPDYIVYTLTEPNDPAFLDGTLWGLRNTGQNGGTAGADIDAVSGWSIRTSADNIVVGVIDTGIRYTHEDIAANMWVNPNETADGTDTSGSGFIDDIHGINAITMSGSPMDDQGHGSHVAGTVGAVGNNAVGLVGVAWDVQLMGLKFLGSSGGGATSDAITCIDYAVAHGAHILNNSWGGSGYSRALHDAVIDARDAGVLFVAAAGNSSASSDLLPLWPAALPVDNVISVASMDRNDNLSHFSNYGEGVVDIGAPGTDIYSLGHQNDTDYRSMSGTSMAAPHVAGALALFWAEHPADDWPAVINRLYRGGTDVPSLANGVVSTGRRLNLHGGLTETEARPMNDDFADARVIYGDDIRLRTFNFGATAEVGEPALGSESEPNSLWFVYTPSAHGTTTVTIPEDAEWWDPMFGVTHEIPYHDLVDALIGVYTGVTLNALGEPLALGTNAVEFTVEADVPYRIALAGVGGAEGLVMIELIGPPPNGTLATARPLTLGTGVAGSNRNADTEDGEPDIVGSPPQASIWFKWTATVTGPVGFSTRGSEIPTRVALYTGPANNPSFAQLTKQLEGAGAPFATYSRLDWIAVAGATYYIQVDGVGGAEGPIGARLAVPPLNQRFADSIVLAGTDVERSFSTVFASYEPGEARHLPNRGNQESVWYTWTAPESGRTTIQTPGAGFYPSIIAVYTGAHVDALNLVVRDGAHNRPARATFDAVAGTAYRIAIEAWDWSIVNGTLRVHQVPVPENELFANAEALEGLRYTTVGSNVGASRETGEPDNNYNGSASVWYKWTAPVSAEVGICGERLDKPRRWNIVLNVFTGTTVNALSHIKEDFGNGVGLDAFVRWNAQAGQTYYLQVTSLDSSGIFGGEGPFRLDLRPIEEHAATNTWFANAIELEGSTVFNYRTHSYAALTEPGEPHHAGFEPRETLWWKWTAEESGRFAVSTAQSEGGWITTIYRTTNPSAPAFNNLVELTNNQHWAAMAFSDMTWEAVAGETYYIVHDRALGARGRFIFQFHKVPDNHVFAGREIITGTHAQIVTHNWGSVREEGEPGLGAASNRRGSRSLWWTWTAPESGLYQLDTIGSQTPVSEDSVVYPDRTLFGFNTRLGVFTGSALGSLTQVAMNFNRTHSSYGDSWFGEQQTSRLEFNAVAGTTYTFLVNGENLDLTENEAQTNTGRICLNLAKLEPPSNALFAGATLITGTHYHVLQPTFGAFKETGEPNHGGINGGRSLWWKWTATESGPFVVSTAGNLYDDYHARRTGLGVYTGSAVNNLSTIASNQNGAGMNTGDGTWSSLTFNAVEGTTYYFGADALHAGNLSFLFTRPAPNDHFANATEKTGSRWVTYGHHLETTVEPDEPRIDGGYFSEPTNNFRSIWYRWTAPVSGEITLDTMGSESVNLIGVFVGNTVDNLTPITPIPRSGGNPYNGDAVRRARDGNNRGPTVFMADAGTTYHISVQGSGFIVPSSGPVRLELTGPPAVPWAPEDFVAMRGPNGEVLLTWVDVAVDEEMYIIERSLDGTSWLPLVERPTDSASFTDFDAVDHGDLFYRIKAWNVVGESEWVHAEITVPMPPPTPGSFDAEAVSHTALLLTWSPPATANALRLERSLTSAEGPWTIVAAQLPGTADQFTDRGLTPATTVHYRLRAYNDLGHSEPAFTFAETLAPPSVNIALDPGVVLESNRTVSATVSRSDTNAPLTLLLRANDARVQPPFSVTLPTGVSQLTFDVDLLDDSITNVSEWATMTAFAPHATIGESFSGAVDTSLDGQNTGWGWGGAWSEATSASVLVEPSLSYTKNGTIATPGTRAARLNDTGSGTDTRRAFNSADVSTNQVWVSAILGRRSTNWGTQLMLRQAAGAWTWVRVRYANNEDHWMLEAGSGNSAPLLGQNINPANHWVVILLDFENREIHAWMDPEASGTVPTNALATATVDMQSNLDAIRRMDLFGYSPHDQFDEIRVADSFAGLFSGDEYTADLRIIDNDALTPLQQWRQTNYGTPLNQGDAANDHAPGEDKWPNLLRYGVGLGAQDPIDVDDLLYPVLLNDGMDIGVRFPRAIAATDIIWEVEQTDTLLAPDWITIWSSMSGSDQQLLHGIEHNGDHEMITIQTPAPLPEHRFLRLRVMEQ